MGRPFSGDKFESASLTLAVPAGLAFFFGNDDFDGLFLIAVRAGGVHLQVQPLPEPPHMGQMDALFITPRKEPSRPPYRFMLGWVLSGVQSLCSCGTEGHHSSK